jgi:hypothetical protein
VRWPPTLWFRDFAKRLDIRAKKEDVAVAVFVNAFNIKEANTAAIHVLRDRYDEVLKMQLPEGSVVDWDSVGSGHRSVVYTELPGAGYGNGDNVKAAEWSLAVATTWFNVLAEYPIPDLEKLVANLVPGAQLGSIDDEDVADGD